MPTRKSRVMAGELPEGVDLRALTAHVDSRGVFSVIFREEWSAGLAPVQWSSTSSEPGVLRGVHVHLVRHDYLLVAQGRASVGLHDLRPGSPTEGAVCLLQLDGQDPAGLTIPAGVAHGFLFHEPSLHIHAATRYGNAAEELGCHWMDPLLDIPWPASPTRLSDVDAGLPPLRKIAGLVPAWQPPHVREPLPAAARRRKAG